MTLYKSNIVYELVNDYSVVKHAVNDVIIQLMKYLMTSQ